MSIRENDMNLKQLAMNIFIDNLMKINKYALRLQRKRITRSKK